MSTLSVVALVMLALVAVKLVVNVGMMREEAARDAEDRSGRQHGLPIMLVEPVPLLAASVLVATDIGLAQGFLLFVVGSAAIGGSYPLGIALGRRLRRRRRAE